MNSATFDYIQNNVRSLPIFVAYAIGIIMGLTRIARLGLPAVLAVGGVGTLLANGLVGIVLRALAFGARANDDSRGIEEFHNWMSIVGAIDLIATTIGISLVIAAVFSGRARLASPSA